MKNVILASSLAVLAAGKATPDIKSMPGATSNSKKVRSMIDAERRKIRESAKADANVAKSSVMAAKSVAKEEGAVFTDAHSYSDFFEITQGYGDCSTTVGRVEGYEAYRCMDWVVDNGDGTASTESEIMIKPTNYGFPIWYFFDGHGCREENLVGHWRMRKTEFGFDRDYAGGCMPMYDGSGSGVPMFHQEAMWHYMRYEPYYPSVMQGIDGKHKGCSRNKYAQYDIVAAYMCLPAYNEDSTTLEYSVFDITSCTSGFVNEVFYSDPACTVMTNSETYERQECVFDYNEFDMYFKDEGDAAFEYRTRDCTWGTPV
jgi:hypothetical protein